MVEATSHHSKQQAIRRFSEKSDSGAFAAELFAPDFQFFVPKYGIGHGAQQFFEMAGADTGRFRWQRGAAQKW
jgi:hypothetical protein